MKRLMIPVIATVFGATAVASYAEEVKMTDQDRTELRQRVDTLRSENAFGRTRDQGAEGRVMQSNDAHPTKSKHTKKQHSKGTHPRPST
jgi:Ni/Co efflux regulator RcnB